MATVESFSGRHPGRRASKKVDSPEATIYQRDIRILLMDARAHGRKWLRFLRESAWGKLLGIALLWKFHGQLPDILEDDSIRAMVFTGEGLDHFSAGMNLKQIPEGVKRAGSPEAFFSQRHRVFDLIEIIVF